MPEVDLPSVQGVKDDLGAFPSVVVLTAVVPETLEPIGAPEYTDAYTTPEQLTDGLLTLSLMPRSRWQTLLNLDTIRVCHK